ncbi:ABC transporter permease subunit [Streptomyces sp. L7]
MVFALSMREVDLSVGGSYAMCSLVVGALLVRDGTPPWLAVPVMLVTGIVLGVFNALVTTLLALPSFIVALGTLMLFRGVGPALADGKADTPISRWTARSSRSRAVIRAGFRSRCGCCSR